MPFRLDGSRCIPGGTCWWSTVDKKCSPYFGIFTRLDNTPMSPRFETPTYLMLYSSCGHSRQIYRQKPWSRRLTLLLFEWAARCEAGRAAILACISSFRHQHSLRGLSEAEGHRHFSCCIIIAGCAVLADFEGWRRDDSHLYFAWSKGANQKR